MPATDISIVLKLVDQATGGLNNFGETVKRNAAGIRSAGLQLAAFGVAVTASMAKLAQTAIEAESARGAFVRLAEANRLSANEILRALQSASRGTVSASDLMLSANRAMTLGVAKNTAQFSTLMEIARDRAKKMGLTTQQAFDNIVTGIGRGSPLILDNLGIVVSATEANDRYAASIGKTASELTEAEKQQALLNAVLEQGRTGIDRAAQNTMTTSEAIQALQASLADLAAVLGEALTPIIRDAAEILSGLAGRVRAWAQANPELAQTVMTVVAAVGLFAAAVGPILIILPSLVSYATLLSAGVQALSASFVGASISVLGFKIAIWEIALLLTGLTMIIYGLNLAWRSLVNHEALKPTFWEQVKSDIKGVFTDIKGLATEALPEMTVAAGDLAGQMDNANAGFRDGASSITSYAQAATLAASSIERTTEAIKNETEALYAQATVRQMNMMAEMEVERRRQEAANPRMADRSRNPYPDVWTYWGQTGGGQAAWRAWQQSAQYAAGGSFLEWAATNGYQPDAATIAAYERLTMTGGSAYTNASPEERAIMDATDASTAASSAEGNIFTHPSLTWVGEKNRPEVVFPLSKLDDFLASRLPGGSKTPGTEVTNQPIQIVLEGGERLAEFVLRIAGNRVSQLQRIS